jgi:hypothetical protein
MAHPSMASSRRGLWTQLTYASLGIFSMRSLQLSMAHTVSDMGAFMLAVGAFGCGSFGVYNLLKAANEMDHLTLVWEASQHTPRGHGTAK